MAGCEIARLPSAPHRDNGPEFHSRALKAACREYGIKLVYRPPATPRFGGHIERLIGAMMGAIHILPDTTFSNTKAREGYASEERAVLSLRELERWLAVEITGVYQRRIHSALLRPTLAGSLPSTRASERGSLFSENRGPASVIIDTRGLRMVSARDGFGSGCAAIQESRRAKSLAARAPPTVLRQFATARETIWAG